MRSSTLALALSVVAVWCACSDAPHSAAPPIPPPEPWEYPDALDPLSETARAQRLAMFRQRNPDVCVEMDAFGRLVAASNCPTPTGPHASDSSAAARIALDFLAGSREFFYLTGDLPAVIAVRRGWNDTWKVYLAGQQCDGCNVYGTGITLRVGSRVFAAEGGHYARVRTPAEPDLTVEEARSKLPFAIVFHCWTPIDATLAPDAPRVIYPLVVGPIDHPTRLELRTAYRFSYEGGGFGGALQDVLLDVMTGEELATLRHVIC